MGSQWTLVVQNNGMAKEPSLHPNAWPSSHPERPELPWAEANLKTLIYSSTVFSDAVPGTTMGNLFPPDNPKNSSYLKLYHVHFSNILPWSLFSWSLDLSSLDL